MHKQQREGFYKITGKETVGSNGWGKKRLSGKDGKNKSMKKVQFICSSSKWYI